MEFLLIAIVIGCIPAAIAQGKGRSFVAWWIYGALLFIVALPHSLMLDPAVSTPAQASPSREPQARPPASAPSSTTKVCPMCAETVQAAARICRFCRHEFPAEPAPPPTALAERGPNDPPRPRHRLGLKPCPSCGGSNWQDANTCSKCGTTFAMATPARTDPAPER